MRLVLLQANLDVKATEEEKYKFKKDLYFANKEASRIEKVIDAEVYRAAKVGEDVEDDKVLPYYDPQLKKRLTYKEAIPIKLKIVLNLNYHLKLLIKYFFN